MDQGWYRYQAVERHILGLIETGALLPGDRLPSLRSLCGRLRLSLSTVNQAYVELERRGTIEARPRSGFFVRHGARPLPPPAAPRPRLEPRLGNRSALIRSVLESLGDPQLLPLSVICPDPQLLPARALARLTAQVLREEPLRALNYDSIHGSPELRRQLAFRALDLGVEAGPDDILITSGAMQALHTALRAVTRAGDTVLIQSPTYYCFLQLLETLSLRAVEIPSSPECGVAPADVRQALDRFDVRACILMPNFNNPDGGTTPSEAKREIVELLAAREIPLIEDDVSGDTAFGAVRPDAFKSFDRRGLVIYCASFSKTIAPGYRVGWMLPGLFQRAAVEIKATTDVACATLPQLAVARYLQQGHYERHLRQLRAAVEQQMHAMSLQLGQAFPAGTRATHPKGGMVLWLELPQRVDSVEFFHRAKAAGIGIAPGRIFSTQDRYNNFIRLSYGLRWNERVRQGIDALGAIAREMAG